MIAFILASTLMLGPVVDEDTELRAVASGANDVVWLLDGDEVARSNAGEAVSFPITAGRHELHAVSPHEGVWEIMVRPEPAGTGATFVQAWTARHEPVARAEQAWRPEVPHWMAGAAFGVLGAGILLWPDRDRRRARRVADGPGSGPPAPTRHDAVDG